MRSRGDVVVVSAPVTNASATLRSFYVDDPDGVPIEFVERLKHVDYAADAPPRRMALAVPFAAEGDADGRL